MPHGAKDLTLSDFLLARIAEDEEVAHGHEGTAYHRWEFVRYRDKLGGYIPGGVAADWQRGAYVPVAQHIARHDPARVLTDCEAKRRIVERHAGHPGNANEPHPVQHATFRQGCDTLRILALSFADHPDYRQEWKP